MCRVPGYCECHKRVVRHFRAYTTSKIPFSRYRGPVKDANPNPYTARLPFLKLKISLASAFSVVQPGPKSLILTTVSGNTRFPRPYVFRGLGITILIDPCVIFKTVYELLIYIRQTLFNPVRVLSVPQKQVRFDSIEQSYPDKTFTTSVPTSPSETGYRGGA